MAGLVTIPKTRTGELDDRALKRLYREMRRVLEMAVDKGAGTQDVERRVPKTWLLPHRKNGSDCRRCDGKIATLKMESRIAYFCPSCQPAPKQQ